MNKIKINLSAKIIGVVILVSIIIFATSSYIHLKQYKDDLTKSFIEKSRSIAYSLDTSIENREDLENKERLQSIIHKNIWLDSDILDIRFNIPEDDNMVTYVSNNLKSVNKEPDKENIRAYQRSTLITKIMQDTYPGILRVITPVHVSGKQVGTFQIDLTLERIEKSIESTIRILFIISLLMTILLIVFLFTFLRTIVIVPILKIKDGIYYVAKGDLNYEVKIKSKDEIGNLAKSFDEMRLGLKDRNDLLNSLLKTFQGKFGNIAIILVRKNVQELVKHNPRIRDILPKMLGKSLKEIKKR